VLRTPATRAAIALLLMLAVGLVFNADGAFFKLGTPTRKQPGGRSAEERPPGFFIRPRDCPSVSDQ